MYHRGLGNKNSKLFGGEFYLPQLRLRHRPSAKPFINTDSAVKL